MTTKLEAVNRSENRIRFITNACLTQGEYIDQMAANMGGYTEEHWEALLALQEADLKIRSLIRREAEAILNA